MARMKVSEEYERFHRLLLPHQVRMLEAQGYEVTVCGLTMSFRHPPTGVPVSTTTPPDPDNRPPSATPVILPPREVLHLHGTSTSTVIGVDGGATGALAVVRGLEVLEVVEWKPNARGFVVSSTSWTSSHPAANLWAAVDLAWPSTAYRGVPIVFEATYQRSDKKIANLPAMCENTGILRGWAMSRGHKELDRIHPSTWRKDTLGDVHAGKEQVLAALNGVDAPGSRRRIVWGLTGDFEGITEHGADAVAIALHAQGFRLTSSQRGRP